MSKPTLFDHDPANGVMEYFHVVEDGKAWAIETRQDLTGLVDTCRAIQNDNTGRWGELELVAIIPPVVQLDLMQKGILGRGLEVLDQKRYKAWLNDNENRGLRTKLGRV